MSNRHYCPKCGAGLISEPIGAPFKCSHCTWHLVTHLAWLELSPFEQGFVWYMQADWKTSELRGTQNPYARGSAKWEAFQQGAQRAALDVQDSEA